MKTYKHGGRRKGSGRPPLKNGHTVRKTATLPKDVSEYIVNLGGGNFSMGVRIAAEFHKAQHAGITALTRVGVVFTDEQKKLIKSLQDAGDMAGAA